jgi:NAD(P)-dependent dehydrogenase (short-subunit alcohol dehydrogenase family)
MGVLDRFRLDGKRLFITGGSRGLGREIALGLAEAGADVVLVGRDEAALAETATDVRARGRQAVTIQADVGRPAEAERACRTALEECGSVDILINNVGGRRVDIPTQEMPVETWQAIMDLNLTSTFVCTKVLGGAMVARGRGGRIRRVIRRGLRDDRRSPASPRGEDAVVGPQGPAGRRHQGGEPLQQL